MSDWKSWLCVINSQSPTASAAKIDSGRSLFLGLALPDMGWVAKAIRDAESRIVGCERCRPETSELLFDSILADALDKHGAFEFVLADPAKCPNCRGEIMEKTLVEPQIGLTV